MNVWLIAAMSADGKIAQSADQCSLDWTSKEDTRFFIDKTKEAGTVIMGRKTFDTIGKPLKGRRIIVMSRGGGKVEKWEGGEVKERGTVEYTSLSPREILDWLVSEGVTTIALAGGSSIYSQFLHDCLVTDLFLTIEPCLFGTGVPLATDFDRLDLRLENVTRLNDQAVLLHYKT